MILSSISNLVDLSRLRSDPSYLLAFIGIASLALALLCIIFRPPAYRRPRRAAFPCNPTAAPNGKRKLTYRTRNGLFYITFSFEQIPVGWRIYIESPPPYDSYGRDGGAHASHRLNDGSRSYVCWSQPLDTFAQAKSVARAWAEATSDYLLHGVSF